MAQWQTLGSRGPRRHNAQMRWALLAMPLAVLSGCKDDKPPPKAEPKVAVVDVDAGDRVVCGFGQTRERGPWDEVMLDGAGAIKWTHVGIVDSKGGQEGFEKTGTFDDTETKDWLQGLVGLGVLDRTSIALPSSDAERTHCVAEIDGRKADWTTPGLPDADLRGKFDALSARALKK
jgi:hypothetical protein